MSDSTTNAGPQMAHTVTEVQGRFGTDAALQIALGNLEVAGYDRANLSLPHDQKSGALPTPNEGAANPVDEIDKTQLRTMGTSMAGYAGAAAIAGATIATGGAAALAAGAAVAVGAGAALFANAAGQAAEKVGADERDQLGAEGRLVLAVRIEKVGQVPEVSSILKQAGATDVTEITRSADMLTAGVSASSWTGG